MIFFNRVFELKRKLQEISGTDPSYVVCGDLNIQGLQYLEVAGFLSLSRDTVYRMAQTGKIPATKVGNQWRFRRADIRAPLRTGITGGFWNY